MIVLDANYILRFILKDNLEMFEIAKNTIINNNVFIPNEVFAEVVFVLQKTYKVPKNEIKDILNKFISFKNINLIDKELIVKSLEIFDKKNLDFVDSILCSYPKEHIIKTFDKKLLKCITNDN